MNAKRDRLVEIDAVVPSAEFRPVLTWILARAEADQMQKRGGCHEGSPLVVVDEGMRLGNPKLISSSDLVKVRLSIGRIVAGTVHRRLEKLDIARAGRAAVTRNLTIMDD